MHVSSYFIVNKVCKRF